MLAVTRQRLIHESDPAEGGGGQRDKPVMHEKVFGDRMGGDQVPKRPVHDQGTARYVILDQKPGQRDCAGIPSLMMKKAVPDLFTGLIDQGTVRMDKERGAAPVFFFQVLQRLLGAFGIVALLYDKDLIRILRSSTIFLPMKQ